MTTSSLTVQVRLVALLQLLADVDLSGAQAK